eukprot:TRINITY_DN3943_c0_g1_i1.p1 TRINITY_DN3943_c0_g1~~TRINITY_DN3943_c0_g1_i1.p1  ORF type:complete len:334 (-),score=89.71 TRINITY_DN3943_c0_g1_i1:888-1889(-)
MTTRPVTVPSRRMSEVERGYSSSQQRQKTPKVAVASRGMPGACDKHRIAHERCPPECPRRAPNIVIHKAPKPVLKVETPAVIQPRFLSNGEPTLDDFIAASVYKQEPNQPMLDADDYKKKLTPEELDILRGIYDQYNGLPPKHVREQIVQRLQWNIGAVYRWFWKESRLRTGGDPEKRPRDKPMPLSAPMSPGSLLLSETSLPPLGHSPRAMFSSNLLDTSDLLAPSAFSGLFSPPSTFSPKGSAPASPRSLWDPPTEPISVDSGLMSPSKFLSIDAQLVLPELSTGPLLPVDTKLFGNPILSSPWAGSLPTQPQYPTVKPPPASVVVANTVR